MAVDAEGPGAEQEYDDPASVKRGLDDIGGAKNVQITRWRAYPQYVGKRLDEVARAEDITDVDAYIRFARDDDAGMIGHAMIEDDLRDLLPAALGDGGQRRRHRQQSSSRRWHLPAGPRPLCSRAALADLPEAIRKMTSMPAARMGLKDRGRIAVGMKADLVLFDPKTVIDNSTFENPRALATGIAKVWVNGRVVWTGAAASGAFPGRVLSR